jgi:predicted dehydrogenase
VQPEIAIAALRNGRPVFIEKPMAADLAGAAAMLQQAGLLPAMMDFNFTEIMAWRKAKALLDGGAIGRLRHVAVNWNVESMSTRLRLKNWKTSGDDGGGVLGNFGSHSLHYLEWFGGPIANLSARLSGLPDDPSFETNLLLGLAFQSSASGSLAVSCASYLGTGHRLEFYGEEGTLVLNNPTADYMRGFAVSYARRPASGLACVAVEDDPLHGQFGDETRVGPVSRLVTRFLDAIQRRRPATPSFTDGYRVQALIGAARQSHVLGQRIEVAPRRLA